MNRTTRVAGTRGAVVAAGSLPARVEELRRGSIARRRFSGAADEVVAGADLLRDGGA